jgi:light-harvesting protein B-800-850 alpha chain
MNQGRIWCVVNPSVGLPLFLGSVATISLIVHYSVLSNTTWMKDFFNGKARTKASLNSTTAPAVANVQPGFTISIVPTSADSNGGSAFLVKVTPTAEATTQASVELPADPPLRTLAFSSPDSR